NAIWRIFGTEKLPPLKCNASASEIVRWKRSNEVADCFCSLFQQNESGVYWIDMITRSAFSMAVVSDLAPEHCAFTLADNLNNRGPSYKSAQALMESEYEGSSIQILQDELDDLFG
ncbi:1827_t:CDS:2, partial [Dentiscutata heterogama]